MNMGEKGKAGENVKKKENSNGSMALGSEAWNGLVRKSLAALGVGVSEAMLLQMAKHVKDMLFWNKTSNLTSITDPHDVAVKHVVDSGSAAVLFEGGERVIDLGTGGGFPGIPLKILVPSLDLTLVDASRKKVNFLKQVIRELSLENIRAVEGRGEELCVADGHQGQYDAVISRAFSGLDLMIPMALPFLKEGGRIIAMKGRDIEHETDLFKNLSSKTPDGEAVKAADLELDVRPYTLPDTDFDRAFMIVRRKK